MAISGYAIPFGLRDIKIVPYTDASAVTLSASLIDLPVAQTLSFSEAEDFQDLRGDDQLITSHGSGPTVEWELEAGGISLEAYVAMNGGTLTVTGVSPNVVKRYRKKVTDQKPSFALIGQSISDAGGDLKCIIYRAKVTDSLEGEFADESFYTTKCKGKGFGSQRITPGDELGTVYDFVHSETLSAIVVPPVGVNEVQRVTITGTPTGGTFTLSYGGQTTAGIAFNAAASAVVSALTALSTIGVGNVTGTGGPLPGSAVDLTFQGTLGGLDVALLTASSASLTGGTTPTVTVTVQTAGG